MVPWPQVITGVVGVVGIAGTIVSGRLAARSATKDLRLSIAAEDARAHTAEKRKIYSAFLLSHTELTHVCISLATKKDKHPWHSADFRNAIGRLSVARHSLAIIAPRTVDEKAGMILATYIHLQTVDVTDAWRDLGKAQAEIVIDMRADLGETPG